MPEFSFDLDAVQLLADHRTPLLTVVFQLFTLLGEIEGFVLVVSLIYATYDKNLALRLSVLVLVTMSLNHVLKTLIANPRPFISEGTHAEKWAVSAAKAQELAAEYSTPSGHAMATSSFYSYLIALVSKRTVRVAALGAILLTGLSRPYLGVHYYEDVLLGWALGVPITLWALHFGDRIGGAWLTLAVTHRFLIVVGSSVVLFLATTPLYAANEHGQPLPFVSYLGLLAGIVLAYPLEERWVGFDPKSSTHLHKALRVGISVGLVLGTLLVLDSTFERLTADSSLLGNALRYLRYAAAGAMGVLGAPFVFVRLKLAGTTRPHGDVHSAS